MIAQMRTGCFRPLIAIADITERDIRSDHALADSKRILAMHADSDRLRAKNGRGPTLPLFLRISPKALLVVREGHLQSCFAGVRLDTAS